MKELYADVFNESCPHKEAKDVALAFKERLHQMHIEVNQLLARKHEYPFLTSLHPLSELLDRLTIKEYSYYLLHTTEFEDQLLDTKEELLDPLKRFMNGEQIKIYDDVKEMLHGNTANFGYIQGDELDILKTLVKSNTPYKGNSVQLAKAAKDQLETRVLKLIAEEKTKASQKAENLIADVRVRKEYSDLSPNEQQEVLAGLERSKSAIEAERFIANIRERAGALSELHTPALNQMANYLAEPASDGQVAEPIAKYIKRSSIHINFDKNELTTEDDVNEYVEVVKEAFLERIHQNLKINLK